MSTFNRRDLLKLAGTFTAYTALSSMAGQMLWIPSALGQMVPVDDLKSNLHPQDAQILVPKSAQFAETLISYNQRTQVTPSVRVLCVTPESVATCIQWAQQHQVPLAMRCGGHSYEGFSQTTGIVIDTRLMNSITLSSSAEDVLVGGGTALGEIYAAISKKNRALPAGSCPHVGVTGHTTGGGYGLLARPFGLACDSLQKIEIVTAQGQILEASEQSNADLFWACRGGGGGSFGVITQLQFKTYHVPQVATFTASWSTNKKTTVSLFKAWQAWAPEAPSNITSLIKVNKSKGLYQVRCVGQTIGTETEVTQELKGSVFKVKAPSKWTLKTKPFIDAVKQFAGKDTSYPTTFMKGKSDYCKTALSDQGLDALMNNLPVGITVIFDSYGGKIRNTSDSATAFAHRQSTLNSIQYYSDWETSAETANNLKIMKNYYDSLREYMSGSAYVNYCDLDLPDYAQSYWGNNLPKLKQIKNMYDPQNFFKHAQSVPLV